MGMMGSVFLLPVFAQTFLGYDATQTGYLFIPMAVAMMLAAPLGGALVGRIQPRFVIFASTLVAGFGLYWFSFLDSRSGPWGIILPLGLMAFGMGFGMSQRTSIIASVVPQAEIGVASSVLIHQLFRSRNFRSFSGGRSGIPSRAGVSQSSCTKR